jgi:hypothetical protein
LVDLKAYLASALADGVRCAEEPGRFVVTASIAGQTREDVEDVCNA